MNKKVMAAAIGGLFSAGFAHAGSITVPAADANATPYAVEGLAAGTDITLPDITYLMGVARTAAQDFTIIITPSAGAAFTAGSCATALTSLNTAGNQTAGAYTATIKRASATECAYEIDVTTATTTATTLVFSGLVLDSHTLNVAGNSASVRVNLWDLGETARIDNSAELARRVAVSGNALRLTAAADTATVADVNNVNGPLFGFVANATAPADTASVASAKFVVNNNSDTTVYRTADNSADWNFGTAGTNIAVTVTGNFQGLATDGFTVDVTNGADPATTVSNGTATFTLLPANVPTVGNHDVVANFEASGTVSLGTSRTFGVSAVGDVVTGSDVTLAGNANWWQWSANASQLMTPYFTLFSAMQSRFFFLNTSASPVTYTATCYAESGNAITYGAGRAGTLVADGMTTVQAGSICTFAGNTRGSIIFTINAPIETIKGSYQAVDPVSLNNSVTPLVRPYTQNATTE
jgi:hypothetical protein